MKSGRKVLIISSLVTLFAVGSFFVIISRSNQQADNNYIAKADADVSETSSETESSAEITEEASEIETVETELSGSGETVSLEDALKELENYLSAPASSPPETQPPAQSETVPQSEAAVTEPETTVPEHPEDDGSMAAAGPTEEADSSSSGFVVADEYGTGTVVPCTTGLLVYYNQADPRWANSLYGPSDPMSTHGCGPTAVAMVVSSFTGNTVSPLDVAKWASDSGYCSKGEGSIHALIPGGMVHYGLAVTSITDKSKENIINEIKQGNIVVALMNKGYFTNGGHFLLLTQVTDDGLIRIADPASWANTNQAWDPDFILSQVRKKASSGGPLWSVNMPEEY